MKTSRSIVLVGVSFKYVCHTWRATSCGEDFAESAGVVPDTERGAGVTGPAVLVVDVVGFEGVVVAGFFAIVLYTRGQSRVRRIGISCVR